MRLPPKQHQQDDALLHHLTGRDPEDPGVYDMINQGRSKGVFLLQSPAQLKMGQRLKSRSLLDLAYQVALIRPGGESREAR